MCNIRREDGCCASLNSSILYLDVRVTPFPHITASRSQWYQRVRGANQPDQYTKQYVVTLTLTLTKLSADDSRVSFITLRLYDATSSRSYNYLDLVHCLILTLRICEMRRQMPFCQIANASAFVTYERRNEERKRKRKPPELLAMGDTRLFQFSTKWVGRCVPSVIESERTAHKPE